MNSFWKNRSVFVTGATGFVGAHIVSHLARFGANIVCLQRGAVKNNSLELIGVINKVKIAKGSIDDLAFLTRIFKEHKIETVFHLAAQAIVSKANNSPLSTFETNIRGTYILLEACRLSESVKRIVVASSDRVYGSQPKVPFHEDFPMLGRFPYDVSKICTDIISQSFAANYDLPVSILRAANIYGEADLNLSRIIPGTILSVLQNENPIIRSDGTPVRDFIHVEDVVNVFLLLAENIDISKGEAFNLGTNEPINMADLANKIIKHLEKQNELSPHILLKPKGEIDIQLLSTDKIQQKLGWFAKINLDQGLIRTINWYRANLSKLF